MTAPHRKDAVKEYDYKTVIADDYEKYKICAPRPRGACLRDATGTCQEERHKVQLIIETDMGNDIDDSIAKLVPKSV